MFILNNTHDRKHSRFFKERGRARPIYDLSQEQLATPANADWKALAPGALVCVILGSKKMTVIYRITEIDTATAEDVLDDEAIGHQVIWAEPVGRMADELSYSIMLKRHSVVHPKLPRLIFPIRFYVANLGDQLDSAPIKKSSFDTIGDLSEG